MNVIQPSVGRTVHYVSHGTPVQQDGSQAYPAVCRAAIITAVHDMDPVPEHQVPYVDLCVLNPTGLFFNQQCLFDGGVPLTFGDMAQHPELAGRTAVYKPGSWHWPERI